MKPAKKPEAPNSGANYGSKPLLIGRTIENICKEKHLTPMQLGAKLGSTYRNVYRLFKRKYLTIPMMMQVSEVLQVNLFAMYYPNIKPVPDPLKVENETLKAENASIKEELKQMSAIAEENKMLKAQLDILREVMKAK